MCERFSVPDRVVAEREFMPDRCWWKFARKFNVAAAQYVPAIRQHAGESEGVMMRWGLIPAATLDKPAGNGHVHVELDEISRADAFRGPWLSSQRCILPVTGFFVWQLTSAKYRHPYFVHLMDRTVFGIAAIWDRWVGEDDDIIESCSVIRVPANEMMANLAPTDQRMPAILRRGDYDKWLRGTPAAAKAALRSYEARRMQAYAVSPRVNSAAQDDVGLIRPAGRPHVAI